LITIAAAAPGASGVTPSLVAATLRHLALTGCVRPEGALQEDERDARMV
jgi:hypothetical protein